MLQPLSHMLRRFERLFEMPGEGDRAVPADRPIRATPPWAKWGVTGIFLACLLLQLSTFVHKARMWPFMRYPMFNAAYQPPVQHRAFVVYAQRADGSEVHIVPEEVGLHFWQFDARVAKPMFYEKIESVEPLRDTVKQWLRLDAAGFRVERQTWELDGDRITIVTEDKTFDVEAPHVP